MWNPFKKKPQIAAPIKFPPVLQNRAKLNPRKRYSRKTVRNTLQLNELACRIKHYGKIRVLYQKSGFGIQQIANRYRTTAEDVLTIVQSVYLSVTACRRTNLSSRHANDLFYVLTNFQKMSKEEAAVIIWGERSQVHPDHWLKTAQQIRNEA